MEEEKLILEDDYEDDSLDTVDDVEMVDIEEGECVEPNAVPQVGQSSDVDVKMALQGTPINDSRQKQKKKRSKRMKKKKKKSHSSGALKVPNMSRFVPDVCRRLKEKKSYLVWSALGCLGVSVLSDLIKEVDAIQACGGQMTADGKRSRTGGGILWSILKTREPNAYKEIMRQGREFEKQFRSTVEQNKEASLPVTPGTLIDQSKAVLDGAENTARVHNQPQQPGVETKRVSVHERIRVPVSYDDALLAENQKGGFSSDVSV